ncbi:MAG TPA: TIGR04104 family putative zinc finger protein [Candidatus Avamphibacillus sp.]|nr:TIGR04104 family putative zinc finger protein [Candidatus Avamphibacillus sp.]
MPTCQNCKSKWSWKQTFKKSFTLDTAMTCPYCGEKQYVTSRTRNISTMITMMIITIVMLMNIFFGPSFIFVFILIGSIPFMVGLYPYWVELSNKEKPLW